MHDPLGPIFRSVTAGVGVINSALRAAAQRPQARKRRRGYGARHLQLTYRRRPAQHRLELQRQSADDFEVSPHEGRKAMTITEVSWIERTDA